MDNNSLGLLDNDELLSVARWHLDQGHFGDALVFTKQLLNRDDTPMEAYRLGGKIYAQLGLFNQAKSAFKTYISHDPNSLTEVFQYGMVHFDSGDSESAINIWSDVLKKENTYPPALFYSALALANLNKTGEALRLLDVLIKSAPSDNLYFERGRQLIRAIEQNQNATGIEDADENRKLEKYKTSDDRVIN